MFRPQTGLTTLIMTLALGGLSSAALASPEVGAPAPAFSGVDTAGKNWSLENLAGRPVILEWTNHDCPYVQKHYDAGNMQALQREATEDGYVWLSVISSAPGKQGHVSADQADALTAKRDAAPTAVILDSDGSMGQAYGARTTPHMYLIDESGTLVFMGGIDDRATTDPADIPDSANYVRLAMAERAAGEPISQPVTRPYGCSVKY
jgi:peroxiredoxin